MGVVKDYNGVDIKQTSHYLEMSCENYIHCLSRTHGWVLVDNNNDSSNNVSVASVEISENDPQDYSE